MVVLRCTQKLLVRLKQAGDLPAVESTTRLGDWYGNILRIGRRQHLLFISERSRLPVVFPISEAKRLRLLEAENTKLKRLLAEAMLDNAALKDLVGKNGSARCLSWTPKTRQLVKV